MYFQKLATIFKYRIAYLIHSKCLCITTLTYAMFYFLKSQSLYLRLTLFVLFSSIFFFFSKPFIPNTLYYLFQFIFYYLLFFLCTYSLVLNHSILHLLYFISSYSLYFYILLLPLLLSLSQTLYYFTLLPCLHRCDSAL